MNECRTTKHNIEEFWNTVFMEVGQIKDKQEEYLIVGDLNLHVGNIVPNNKEKINIGGKLLREFIEDEGCILINATSKTRGGPFTRYDLTDPNNIHKKSCLDLFIVSANLFEYVEELAILNKLQMTP